MCIYKTKTKSTPIGRTSELVFSLFESYPQFFRSSDRPIAVVLHRCYPSCWSNSHANLTPHSSLVIWRGPIDPILGIWSVRCARLKPNLTQSAFQPRFQRHDRRLPATELADLRIGSSIMSWADITEWYTRRVSGCVFCMLRSRSTDMHTFVYSFRRRR